MSSRLQLVALALLAGLLASCDHGPQEVRIAIVTNGASPFWEPMQVGAERAAAELGCKVTIQHPARANSSEQIRLVENMVSQGVDGISVSPLDPDALTDTVQKAMAAGIPVICMDSDAPNTGRLAYIGTINYKAGQAAGEATKKVFPNGAKMVAQVGSLTAQNARDRLAGFKDAVDGAGIEIVEIMTDDINAPKAQGNAETALQKYPDMAAFLCLYSYNAPAAARALESVGKVGQVKIIGFDAEPQTLEYLEKGVIDVCIGQKPYEFGRRSVELLYRIKTEGRDKVLSELPDDRVIDTGVDVITRDNLPAYKENLARLGIKSS
ncbi:sugar-binding protein [bacterium]|nr:sugar-binding protein [bacterium]